MDDTPLRFTTCTRLGTRLTRLSSLDISRIVDLTPTFWVVKKLMMFSQFSGLWYRKGSSKIMKDEAPVVWSAARSERAMPTAKLVSCFSAPLNSSKVVLPVVERAVTLN